MFYKRGATHATIFIISVSFLIPNFKIQAITAGDLVISQVQITGGAGKTSQDYISVYNKSDAVIDLNGLRLVKRTKTGTADTTIKSWVSPILLNPGAYHLWANSADGFSSSLNANSESSQTISDDNGIAIREGAENTGTIIDSFAWGAASNIFAEISPYSTNHTGGQYYSRINNQDTNNNALDFEILSHIITPICGNGLVEIGETCDDNNTLSNDGCSSTCQLEISQAVCGNSILEIGETCDDGNTSSSDGCDSTCQIEIIKPVCGNSIIETSETCDDGNSNSNDGCNNLCQIENLTTDLGDVRINELVSDPESDNEWIELYNTTSKEINLNSWTIEDGSGTKTLLSNTIDKWFIITKPKGALNNSGDIVILKNKDADIIDSITYGDWDDGEPTNNAPVATKPYALARIHNGESTNNDSLDFKVTTTLTKGTTNIITEPNEDNNISDNISTEANYDYSQDIIISEIFPNPIGLDNEAINGEFIELYNKGDKNVLLNGWRLEVNGSIMELPLNTTIYAKQYLTLTTKNILPLPNDGATVKLFQPQKQTSYQSVTYKKALEGQSYANFLTSGWQWTNKSTPNTDNILIQAPRANFDLLDEPIVNEAIRFDSSDSFLNTKPAIYSWNFGDNQTNNLANPSHIFTSTGKHSISLTIKTDYGINTISKNITVLKNTAENTEPNQAENTIASITTDAKTTEKKTTPEKENSLTTVTGTAVAAPNIFGSQYFFFLPNHGEPLYKIYNNKKLFPKIKAGDSLEITGDYSEPEDGPQLKTKTEADIKIIGRAEITKPELSISTDLKLPPYPRLALVQGEVVSKKSPRIYLTDEQGEIEIYLNTGTKLKVSNFTVGDKISVLGVLTTSKGTVRLQPRSEADIKKIETSDFSAASLTEPTAVNTIDLTTKETAPKKTIIFYYLIAGGIIILAATIYFVYGPRHS